MEFINCTDRANTLCEKVNDWMYETDGCLDWAMKAYCIQNNFMSYDEIEDEWVVTPKDVFEACLDLMDEETAHTILDY